MSIEIKELETESELESIVLFTLNIDDSIKVRIKQDFKNHSFRCLYALSDQTCLSYIIICDSYSTWQHRIFYCSDIYLHSSLDTAEKKLNILKMLFDKLFEIARDNHYHRVNLNINNEINKEIIDLVVKLGAKNLTKEEDWLIFEMKHDQMIEFSQLELAQIESEYKLIKLDTNNVSVYINQVIDLVKEIAIFEKMEDQFETSRDDLIRDFQFDKNNLRFYELFVLVKNETEVVGYSFYHRKYELIKGLGFYMEELYIRENYRHKGFGTLLWQTVTKDILDNYKEANYVHWTVLGYFS
jgi:GNAT superfamily N-acetyltransferase